MQRSIVLVAALSCVTFATAAGAALAAAPGRPSAPPTAGPWRMGIDTAHSTVGFHVGVAGGLTRVSGRFDSFEGVLIYDPEHPEASAVEFVIDAGSVNTGHSGRDSHVRSEDFLDVEQHPTMVFRSTAVGVSDGEYVVDGEFTLRGTTRPLRLEMRRTHTPPTLDLNGTATAIFEGSLTLSRSDYGIRATPSWNRILAATGELTMSDEVAIDLRIIAQAIAAESESQPVVGFTPADASRASRRPVVMPAGRAVPTPRRAQDPVVPLGSAIEVDGRRAAGEWDDALSVAFTSTAGDVAVHVKHDGVALLVGFTGLGADPFRVPEVLVSTDPAATTWGPSAWWFHASFADCVNQGRHDDYDTCGETPDVWQANNLRDGDDGEPLFPAITEMRIPFATLGAAAGDRLRLAFVATDTTSAWELWPDDASVSQPASWTIVRLGSGDPGAALASYRPHDS